MNEKIILLFTFSPKIKQGMIVVQWITFCFSMPRVVGSILATGKNIVRFLYSRSHLATEWQTGECYLCPVITL